MLSEAGIANSSNEARWLLESLTGVKAGKLLLSADEETGEEQTGKYLSMIKERISGRPLQYIIGRWDFYGREFYVGEGVLIPRPETEQLVEIALDYLKDKEKPAVLDLCAGTGCIGLTLAKERADSFVTLVEKYDEALGFLKRNAEKLGAENVRTVRGDILNPADIPQGGYDLIVSNPPYVPAAEIPSLEPEVLREPATALDGGEDGLDFYYAISEISRRLGNCPVLVECGEGQEQAICGMFSSSRVYEDFNSINRFVFGE